MNKIISWYNANKKTLWISILIIILMIGITQALNNNLKKQKKNNGSSSNENITTTSGNKDYSVISKKNIEKKNSEENNTLIDEFITFCNEADVEQAYELLSNNCKEKLYNNIEDFENNYYKTIFTSKKNYDKQAWFTQNSCYTYKIKLTEDMLSSGNANASVIEDYYTIIKENGKNKLNINGYINTENINKTEETEEIKITVKSKDIYMDYEIYNLNVENKYGKVLLLDSLEKPKTMYIEDQEGLDYYALNHELIIDKLRVKNSKDISIKYNKKYTNQAIIDEMVFTDVILDFNNYTKYDEKSDYADRIKVRIEF